MARIARLNDPIDHGGHVITAATKTRANGKLIARVGDYVNCTVHGIQTIVEGSADFMVEGAKVARVGSLCSCGARITDGGSNSECG